MNNIFKIFLVINLFFFNNVFASGKDDHDKHKYKIGKIEIEHPYTYVTPAGSKVAAGYMKIENDALSRNRLVSVTNVNFADHAEIHEMRMENQVMKMRPLEKGLLIPGKMEIYLKPSGYHIMFVDLKEPIQKGKKYKATLNFEKGGAVDVYFMGVTRGFHPDQNHSKHY